MKILMLGWELPPHNSGGLGVACYHMSKALAISGASIDFVVPYEAEHPNVSYMNIHAATKLSPLERYGLNAYDSASKFFEHKENDTDTLTTIRAVQSRYVQFVEEFIADNPPEVIHAHDWLTMEAGVRAKELTDAPLVVHVHATEFDRAGAASGNPLVHEIEQEGLLVADRIIAVSEITKNIIVDRYAIPADKIEVVYNAIDPSDLGEHTYDTRTYSYLESLKKEGYTVVSVMTRFTVQKGLTHFMEAARLAISRYEKLAFLFAGDGEQRDELLALAAKYGISDRVFFTGFVRGKQWRDAYIVSDVFVMSSVSEPFGLTALEAAHHDTALIITNQSGVGEVLSSIFRYDFWDTYRLADQLVGIATSPALKSSLKINVKREYARLSWQEVAEKCIRIYEAHKKVGVMA